MRFTIPGELTDYNTHENLARRNKFAAAKNKKENTTIVAWSCKRIPKVTDKAHFIFHWYMPNKRKDPDNIAYAKKFILDGLQEAGVLENDGWGQVRGFEDRFYVDVENPRVEVEIKVLTEKN